MSVQDRLLSVIWLVLHFALQVLVQFPKSSSSMAGLQHPGSMQEWQGLLCLLPTLSAPLLDPPESAAFTSRDVWAAYVQYMGKLWWRYAWTLQHRQKNSWQTPYPFFCLAPTSPCFYKEAIFLYTDSHGSSLVFSPSATPRCNTTENLKMARSGNPMINRGVALDWLKDEKIIGEAEPNTNKCPEQGLTQERPNPKTLDCPEGRSWWEAGGTQVLNEDFALTVFM